MTEDKQLDRCGTCGNPTAASSADGCTPYTCMHPCATCGHIGDVHRDWYIPGFCRQCREGKAHHHDYVAA